MRLSADEIMANLDRNGSKRSADPSSAAAAPRTGTQSESTTTAKTDNVLYRQAIAADALFKRECKSYSFNQIIRLSLPVTSFHDLAKARGLTLAVSIDPVLIVALTPIDR